MTAIQEKMSYHLTKPQHLMC